MDENSRWSALPQCLLEVILKRLTVPHSLCFGSVCRSWCIAQRECRRHHGLPFIVFRSLSGKRRIVEVFSLYDKRKYKLSVPKLELCSICLSSSHGWMMLQTTNRCLTLLVKDKECITLPMEKISFRYLDCLFFSTPSDPDGILFIRKSNNTFLLYRRCDRLFQEHQWKGGTVVSNTIFCGGKLYTFSLEKDDERALHAWINEDYNLNDENWNLAVVNPLCPGNTTFMNMKLNIGNDTHFQPTVGHRVFILVESFGEILLVRMMGTRVCRRFRGLRCDVFQADFTKMEWIKLENLGDRMLFLSKGSSVSICASEMGCEGNRIFYIPNMSERLEKTYLEMEHANGSYMELELGRDGVITRVTTHRIPMRNNRLVVFCGPWLTPYIS